MSPLRLLDRLQRRSRQYLFDRRAGVRNPKLAATIFDLADEIRERVPAKLAADVERLSRVTERFVRIANTGKRAEIETVRLEQCDAIAVIARRLQPAEVRA